MKEIYICYSNIDREAVLPAVEKIEDAGFSCCLPGRDIVFDQSWEQSVTDAIHESVMILSFESENSRRSFRLAKELKEAKISGLLILSFEVGSVSSEEVMAAVSEKLPEARKVKEDVSVIVPYGGDLPYIFASYSHKDKERVFEVLRLLQRRGYRVWFDEGIDPGTEWDDNIADHLEAAGYLIPFFTENFFGSQNCNDELFFARELGLNILPVYLEDVKLDPGIAMRFGRKQALFYHKYTDKNQFLKKLDSAKDIGTCLDDSIEG